MKPIHARVIPAVCLAALFACAGPPVRFATFNVSLYRNAPGELARDLARGDNEAARAVAAIIQRVRPDVLLLNEFDYDAISAGLNGFRANYLGVGQHGQQPIQYPFVFTAPVNTGVLTGFDLDHDGTDDSPNDAQGFGRHPGMYGMVVLSKFPIETTGVRTFREFLWRDMPRSRIPKGWYSPAVLAVLRLSSKSHWDLPIRIHDRVVHLLASHPTPPAFDGEEDRNGRRNHDEIRLWADYVDPMRSVYLVDDKGLRGGLADDAAFVIAGDLNADPADGDDRGAAIAQLLTHPRIARTSAPRSAGSSEATLRDANEHSGDGATDTADFGEPVPGNLRVDYVLPSANLRPGASGVFWPVAGDPLARLLRHSDHRLVWVDVRL